MFKIKVGESQIAYRHIGPVEGETVVLLHSSACSSTQWRDLAESLADRYRVIVPDLYGYGESTPWRDSLRLRLDDEARAVEAVLAAVEGPDPGPIHLVGHSFGGAVALKLALRGTLELSSLTLIEPVSFHLLWNDDPLGAPSFAEIRRLSDGVAAALERGDRAAAMQGFVDYWNGEGTWAALSERKREALQGVAPKIAEDFYAAITEPTDLETVAELRVPTLLLCGGASPVPTRRIFQMLAGALRASRGLELRGAGHMLPLTHARQVNSVVTDHIETFAQQRRLAA